MSKSEAAVQTRVRIAASKKGMRVWRNNVGAVTTAEGDHVRYGLANESAKMNKEIKSSDLIGIEPITITPDMVGQTIGRFVALEVKREGWTFRGTAREKAQARFLEIVQSLGGRGEFISDEENV